MLRNGKAGGSLVLLGMLYRAKGGIDMGWITTTPYEALHQCDLPELEDHKDVGVGSVWACDECNTRFIITNYEGCMIWAPAKGFALLLKEEDGVE